MNIVIEEKRVRLKLKEGITSLKINGENKIRVLYSQGKGDEHYKFDKNTQIKYRPEKGGEFTPDTFHRRSYCLIDHPKYILVHYLDEANLSEA